MTSDVLTILVIDSSKTASKALNQHLNSCGCEVFCVDSEARALETLASVKMDVVFYFAHAQQESEVSFIKKICLQGMELLVCIVAENLEREILLEFFKAGARDYLEFAEVSVQLRPTLSRFQRIAIWRGKRVMNPTSLDYGSIQLRLTSEAQGVGPAVNSICGVLAGFIDESELLKLTVALEEMIMNAYDHGNLGITFDEKKMELEAVKLEHLL